MISTIQNRRTHAHQNVRQYTWVSVEHVCLYTRMKVKNYINEIHQNVNGKSWSAGFDSFFYTF